MSTTGVFSSSLMQSMFKTVDRNDDGVLSKTELKKAFDKFKDKAKDSDDGLSDADKQSVSLIKTLAKLYDVLQTVDGKEGVSMKELKQVSSLDDEGGLSPEDAKNMMAQYKSRMEDRKALMEQRYQAQLMASQGGGQGLMGATQFGIGGAYTPMVNNGTLAMPTYLSSLLDGATMMSSQAMMGLDGLSQTYGGLATAQAAMAGG